MQKKIYSFQSLRAIAILAIFLGHLVYFEKIKNLSTLFLHISYSRFPVNIFFVLSGFIMAYIYGGISEYLKWGKFIKRRYAKIYIPYLFCLIIGIFRYFFNFFQDEGILSFFFRLVVAIPVFQAVIPYGNISHSFNGVAWFLSCTMIFYMLTPRLLFLNNWISRKKRLAAICYLLNLVGFGICYMVFRYLQYYRFPDFQLSLVYSTVYIRIFSFMAGILCFDIREDFREATYCVSNFELPLAIITIFWWLFAGISPLPMVFQELINIILASLLIIVFSFDKGIVSSHLNRQKELLYFGDISLEFYLIHYLVINIGIDLIEPVLIKNVLNGLISAFAFFVISLFLSVILHCFSSKFYTFLIHKQKST